MRVGLLCPYSLSIPGGVQGQVLGLARTLRSRGHEARVLGPCDGPPPAPFVTPLGKSVPAAANGSVAPLAPDPAAQLRTMRALWDEDFDVLHLHEPFAPGPCMTALVIKPAPIVGTFHAAGESFAYKHMGAGTRFLNRRLDLRCAVSEDARQLASSAAAGEFTPPLQRGRARPLPRRRAVADRRADDLLLRAPRAPQGPRGAARGHGRPARRRPALGRQRRARRPPRSGPAGPATPGSSGWGGCPTRRRWPGCGGPTSSAPRRLRGESFGVVLHRGDGGRDRRSWPPTCRGTPTSPGPTSTPCWSRPATPRRWPAALARVLGDAGLRRPPGRLRDGAGRGVLDGPAGRPLPATLRAGRMPAPQTGWLRSGRRP